MPGMWILFRFFDPGTGVLQSKAVPVVGILTEKVSARGLAWGWRVMWVIRKQ